MEMSYYFSLSLCTCINFLVLFYRPIKKYKTVPPWHSHMFIDM